jgi:hypothetical protein
VLHAHGVRCVGLARTIYIYTVYTRYFIYGVYTVICGRVGQNHIYTVYIRCFYIWRIYGHIRCVYTVLANPRNVGCEHALGTECPFPHQCLLLQFDVTCHQAHQVAHIQGTESVQLPRQLGALKAQTCGRNGVEWLLCVCLCVCVFVCLCVCVSVCMYVCAQNRDGNLRNWHAPHPFPLRTDRWHCLLICVYVCSCVCVHVCSCVCVSVCIATRMKYEQADKSAMQTGAGCCTQEM